MIAKGGRVFFALSVVGALTTLPFVPLASAVLGALAVLFLLVFRDPRRQIGPHIVAPADGVVRDVDQGGGLISTYLSLRNVHVTRAPIEGLIEKRELRRGGHAPAFSSRTPANERLEIVLRTPIGRVSIVQMTGAIARRIVPYVREGQRVLKGEKLGLIRFGSRVDLHLPPNRVVILVSKGERLRAGSTSIAEVRDGRLE